MAADEGLGKAEFAAERPDLVLEEEAQGLHQAQAHPLGKAAHVVVRLDGDRRPSRRRNALDHVRVERALGEEVAANGLGLLLENLDEETADGLALRLGIRHAVERVEEEVGRVHLVEEDVVAA